MEKWVKFLSYGLTAISLFASICCTGDVHIQEKSGEDRPSIQPDGVASKSIPTILSDDHVLVFIDKSNSMDPNRPLFTKDQGNKIREILETNGGHLTIYFIHKNLTSAPFHFERNFEKPDTKNMVEIKAKTHINKFRNSLDSITYFVNDAIHAHANSSNSKETDMWATVRKINEEFSNKSEKARLHVVYLSDMIESVTDPMCGKDYTKKKMTTAAMAQELAEVDYPLFQKCYNIKSLPKNISVMIYFPSDSNTDKDYRNYTEYWRALFAKFGVNAVKSNI